MMEALSSSKTLVLERATRSNIPEDAMRQDAALQLQWPHDPTFMSQVMATFCVQLSETCADFLSSKAICGATFESDIKFCYFEDTLQISFYRSPLATVGDLGDLGHFTFATSRSMDECRTAPPDSDSAKAVVIWNSPAFSCRLWQEILPRGTKQASHRWGTD
jgi:hypothetical protein